MKVKYITKIGYQYNESYEYLEPHCPNCNKELNETGDIDSNGFAEGSPNYCSRCGIKLDWKKE